MAITTKGFNLARMTTATVGAGAMTLGAAVSGYLTFALAGVANGDTVPYGIKDGANSEVGLGVYSSAGPTLTRVVTSSTNSNAAIVLSGAAEVFITPRAQDVAPIDGYLFGCTLSAAGGTAIFGVTAGAAADSTGSDIIRLTSAFTKTTGAWSLGSGGGSFDGTGTGPSAAAVWVHVFAIKRPDTLVTDVLTSLSATAPTLPANYTLFRRIGSLRSDGSFVWLKFAQEGDIFYWDATVNDVNVGTLTNASGTLYTLTVPTGVKVRAMIRGYFAFASGQNLLITSPSESDQVTNSVTGNNTYFSPSGVSGTVPFPHLEILTDTSARIRARGSVASMTLAIATFGWIDKRGREA